MTKQNRKRTELTPEERRIAGLLMSKWLAMKSADPKLNQADIASRIGKGMTQGMFSHLINGRERVSEAIAPGLAAELDFKPEEISIAYREKVATIDQLRDDILALRYAVTSLATVLSEKRPAEGDAFDDRIRQLAEPYPRFLEGAGWLGVLLEQIRVARGISAASSLPAQVRKAASKSTRTK